MRIQQSHQFQVHFGGKSVPVAQNSHSEAELLDLNGDGFLQGSEIGAVILEDGVSHRSSEGRDLILEYKSLLTGLPNPNLAGYHSFAEVERKLDEMAEAHPELVQKMSLGKSSEGRDIWALKVSSGASGDTSHKTGLVVTGCTHAREWVTVEAPLKFLSDILDHKDTPENRKRLEEAEIWVVPVVNPDGYEYTRNVDSWWRKNRRPLETDQNGKATDAVGVDLNRNYWDGKPEHLHVYRPPGDKPGNTRDDYSATSDNPHKDTYRGPYGGSEPEVRALLDLELNRPNIKGVVDYHSYGDVILYPYGHTREESPNVALYKEIGKKMQSASSGFSLKQSVGLYPASGTSDDTHDLNGILNFTIEMGRSFQPNPRSVPEITDRVSKATMAWVDEMIVKDDQGVLPRK